MVVAGHLQPDRLSHAHILSACSRFNELSVSTRYQRFMGMRDVLRHVAEVCGVADLSRAVPKVPAPTPRSVVVTMEERARIMAAAEPGLRCWLLMCSDLAIRSGTAATLALPNYVAAERKLRFTTKYQANQDLPVTAELAALLDVCRHPTLPFIAQLWQKRRVAVVTLRKNFKKLLREVGIERDIRPHDLRRTTAVRAYDVTRDLRVVQAILGHKYLHTTLHYLDHRNAAVSLSTLELLKLNERGKVQ